MGFSFAMIHKFQDRARDRGRVQDIEILQEILDIAMIVRLERVAELSKRVARDVVQT